MTARPGKWKTMKRKLDPSGLFNLIILILAVCFIGLLLSLITWAHGISYEAPVRTEKQMALHEAAEILRAAGYTDDSEPIRALSAAWWTEQQDLCIVAKVIEHEAGDCPWDHRVAVGAVVLNRVADPRFPMTVREVVVQPGQYLPSYTFGFERVRRSSFEAAAAAMDGRHDVPADVVWQANFPQGREAWWISYVNTGSYASTTYFCR